MRHEKKVITLNYRYSMITLNGSPPKVTLRCLLSAWYLISLLKLSGPDGTGAHLKVIKIIMENFKGGPNEVQYTPYIYGRLIR